MQTFVADSVSTALVENAKTAADVTVAELAAVELQSDAEAAAFALRLREVDDQAKTIQTQLDKIVKPLNESIAEARKFFKPGLEACALITRAMKNVLNAWGDKVRERAAALRKLQDAERAKVLAAQAKPTVAAAAVVQQATVDASAARANAISVTGNVTPELAKTSVNASTGGAVKSRGDWKHAIVNVDMIPRRFMEVNETAIRRFIAEQKKLGKLRVDEHDEPVCEASIPGVAFSFVRDTVL